MDRAAETARFNPGTRRGGDQERDALLRELHELKTRIAKTNAQREAIMRARAEVMFATAQRDPNAWLQ